MLVWLNSFKYIACAIVQFYGCDSVPLSATKEAQSRNSHLRYLFLMRKIEVKRTSIYWCAHTGTCTETSWW